MSETPTKKNALLKVLLWWNVDKQSLKEQVDKYESLGWQAARKISAALLVFSSVLTLAVAHFTSNHEAIVDGIIFGFLAIFVFLGKRWAIMGAMVVWTYEKGFMLFTDPGKNPITQIIWWCFYMSYFYLAWKVENNRRSSPPSRSPNAQSKKQEPEKSA